MTGPITADEINQVRALAIQGLTLEDIAGKLGRNYHTIRKRVRAEGITVRRPVIAEGAELPGDVTPNQIRVIEARIEQRQSNRMIADRTGLPFDTIAAVRANRKLRLRREREGMLRRHEYSPGARVRETDSSLEDSGKLLSALQAAELIDPPPKMSRFAPPVNCAAPLGVPVRFGGMARVGV